MTTESLPTAVLPPPRTGPSWLPLPGTYTAAPGRCIAELTARLGPLPTLRRRLTAEQAGLTVAPDAEDCVLSLELTGRPLRGRTLGFVSTSITPEADGSRLSVPGELALDGADGSDDAFVPAELTLRVVDRADSQLLALGALRLPYGPLRRTTGLTLPRTRPADRIRLLVAVEFTCPA
ncbi:hypothetical protein [Streptomyces purpurascens]|uniref:hypothetical protein n=1 Tax=Streptomyces purpurascens TaxID=1924 RepID=UPI0016758ED7|nr:hypothetical protein [Streptomyces purpurascens]MCE7050355.1 hypothetical protein [Streptomyces purpurascens]GHA58617.1 hypothetical protein GCM10010303_83030 [Streptomyces purpurascens]